MAPYACDVSKSKNGIQINLKTKSWGATKINLVGISEIIKIHSKGREQRESNWDFVWTSES